MNTPLNYYICFQFCWYWKYCSYVSWFWLVYILIYSAKLVFLLLVSSLVSSFSLIIYSAKLDTLLTVILRIRKGAQMTLYSKEFVKLANLPLINRRSSYINVSCNVRFSRLRKQSDNMRKLANAKGFSLDTTLLFLKETSPDLKRKIPYITLPGMQIGKIQPITKWRSLHPLFPNLPYKS